MSERVPEDLQLDILVRLSVKSLLRFQCVSKSLMSLISRTGFISMHIKHNESTNNYARIFYGILSPITDTDDTINFRYILNQFDDSFSEIQQFDFPSQTRHEFDEVLVCRGLLLITIGIVLSDVEPFFLWNPALRMSVTLPRPCFGVLYPTYHIVHGFGYDHISNDYKVLRMMYTYIYSSGIPYRAEMFKLSTGPWETLGVNDDFHSTKLERNLGQVFMNGANHWVGRTNKFRGSWSMEKC
ncbi:hypothetical protein FH972_001140 [Carpinus fangiana]|uniref:Uncharacterized protein n=1 Tax=Carpinus fangiana TaxID=176857 RepID=A0A5N6QDZ5_9ROSI|nr:hypothetical protein FH972_001140 [Carpinus fangiana]